MISWDDCITLTQNFTSDFTTDSATFQKLLMNIGYHYILSELGRTNTEKTVTATTVAAQQFYQLPKDYLFFKSMTITIGGVPYVLSEEESQEAWDLLNSSNQQQADIPVKFFLRNSFGADSAEIGIFPVPASSGNTVTVVYESSDKDLSQTAYTTGTVTVTNANAAVVGVGTTFIASMVGRYLVQTDATGDGLFYKIASFTDATHITLENVYGGTTTAGAGYKIVEAFALPEAIEQLPCYFAAQEYWLAKKDSEMHGIYKGKFDDGLTLAKRRYGTKSRSSLTRGNQYYSRWRTATPAYFPLTVS